MSESSGVVGTRRGRRAARRHPVSHSHERTSRRWDPNIQSERRWLTGENRDVTLRVSDKGTTTADVQGIETVVRHRSAHEVEV